MAEYFPIDVSSFGSYSGSFSGSFFGNGSRLTGITASFFSGSVTSASYAATASYLLGSIASASYALTASYVNPLVQNVIITGSTYLTDSIYFSGSGPAGRLVWNDVDGTLQLGLKGGVVNSELGQGLITRIVNKTVPNIYLSGSNYQVVVVAGAQGQRLAVKLAQADNDANSAGTLGLVAENIDKNQEGFIVTVGLLKNRNTTGALQGETWTDGDVLFLSPTTAGAITNIKPQAPQHTVIVGYVEYAHAINGKIYVKIDNGYELDELHNVRITTASLSSGDLLVYSSSVWVNTKQLTGSYGLTGSLQATSFTGSLFGTASWATNALTASFITTASTNAFVQGGNSFGAQALLGTNDNQSLAFETSGSTRMFISSSGNVGIGTSTPSRSLDIRGTARLENAGNAEFDIIGGGGTTFRVASTSTQTLLGTLNSFPLTFYTNASERARFTTGGNFLIGTTTDSARLTVRGSGATSSTTTFRTENTNASASLEIYDSNGKIDIYRGNNATISADGIFVYGPFTTQFGANTSNKGIITFLQQELSSSVYSGIQASHINYGNVRAGVYFVGGNSIRFVAGSTVSPNDKNMFFSANGNFTVGGLTDAGYRLDVSGSSRFNGTTLTLGTTGLLSTWQGTNHSLYFYHENSTTFRILSSLGPALDVKADSFRFVNSPLVVGANVTPLARLHVQGSGTTSATTALRVENSSASPSLVVLDNGYVSIGTGSAAYKLDVLDSAATYVAQFRGSNSSYIISGDTSLAGESGLNARNNTGQMFLAISASIITLSGAGGANTVAFRPGGSERMRVNSSGNVLIGTTTDAGFRLDVSGSGRFTNGLTVTGSLIATSFTGSLQGTASWATNVVSASGVSTNIQYNSSGLLAGSNRFTFDGTNVRVSGGNVIITGSLSITGSSIITGSLQVGVPGTNAAAIDSTVGTLSRGSVTTIDWVNRSLIDTSVITSADWENRALYDTSAVTSVDWNNRAAFDNGGISSIGWNERSLLTPAGNNFSWGNDYYTTSNIYHTSIIGTTTQDGFIDNANPPYAGQIIRGTVDAAVTAGQLVDLESDGIWYSVKNLAPNATRMLGICVDQATGQVLIEGDAGVSDDNTFGTYVVSASIGLPVYVGTANGYLETAQPTNGVVRTVGHIYYQSTTTANYWLMKFRPSNDWYEQ